MTRQLSLFLLQLLQLFSLLSSSNTLYNVVNFGAKSDGQSDSTQSFLRAWTSACHSPLSATIYVPSGTFLVNPIIFDGPCRTTTIEFEIEGTIVAPDYNKLGSYTRWITFHNVNGVTISGGSFDGRGAALWACKAGNQNCPLGAPSLFFSELFHIVINSCQGVTIQGIKILAPGNSPNTDGIHVEMSTDVTIVGTSIKTGDDCISIGPGTTNLWIEHVTCGPGHGISIGSLGKGYQESGVENVTVKSTVFIGTQNGLRIKTWGRPSEGFVKGVIFEHALMQDVENPIIIDQNYCPSNKGCPDQDSGVRISDVTYNDIQGSSATPVAVNFDCSASNPCNGIELQDIKLIYGNEPAKSSCKHAGGTASGFIVPPSCL